MHASSARFKLLDHFSKSHSRPNALASTLILLLVRDAGAALEGMVCSRPAINANWGLWRFNRQIEKPKKTSKINHRPCPQKTAVTSKAARRRPPHDHRPRSVGRNVYYDSLCLCRLLTISRSSKFPNFSSEVVFLFGAGRAR